MPETNLMTERILAGQCPGCGRKRCRCWCATCKARNRRFQANRRARMKAAGLCKCGRAPKKGRASCVACITAATTRKQLRKAREAARG